MRLEDAYELLEVPPTASDDEVKSAHRDLTKVWHPDRFAHDPVMQARAEAKSKAINEALETIRAARTGRYWRRSAPPAYEAPVPDSPAQQLRRLLLWMAACVLLGLFVLVRRPTFGGLIVASVLFGVALFLILRMRKIERGLPPR